MDEMTLLRKVRDEVHAEEAALERGRDDLIHRIGSRRPRRRTLRRVGLVGIPTLIAAGVAAALVVTNVVGAGPYEGNSEPATAAEILGDAALATVKFSEPKVPAGHYLKVVDHDVNFAVDLNSPGSTFLWESSEELYVPADRSDEWVDVTHPSGIYKTFGAASEQAAAGFLQDQASVQTQIIRSPGGNEFTGTPLPSAEFYRSLPTNPKKLYLYAQAKSAGTAEDANASTFYWIVSQLRAPFVPAKVRATLFKAAAMIPGIEIVDRRANLDGRTGIAIAMPSHLDSKFEVIIDPHTGEVIGDRQVVTAVSTNWNGLPKGTVVRYSATTMTVVDSAPEGGLVCTMERDGTQINPACPGN